MQTYKDLKSWQINQNCIRETLNLLKGLTNDFALQHIGKQLFRSISSVGANLAEDMTVI
jgi:predicted transglutaminase-like protease